ncbi:type 1 pili tip component [Aestuariirhabdus sp. LZHN29]|uniref:type 1 pili tip component n=1 Tax=Aestuariirhabdus sp. LZHN29 TaxID=3417462 RepID=UPI003CF1967B
MNNVRDLIRTWEAKASKACRVKEVKVKLTNHDYAKLCALAEIYGCQTQEQILGDLVATVLKEVEEALPYIPGKKIIARDDQGDPIYEDVGLTPRFEALTQKHAQLPDK